MNNWIDNFDPRAMSFYDAKSDKELFDSLRRNGIKYVLVPHYTWPTIYNTQFKSFLSNPKYSTPMIENIDFKSKKSYYQLFEIKENSPVVSCRKRTFVEATFLKPKGGISARLFDTALGIPITYQGSMERFNLERKSASRNLGLNPRSILRDFSPNLNWYDPGFFETKSRKISVRVKLNSDSLVSLQVQGILNRSAKRNLFEATRLVNVAEDFNVSGDVDLSALILVPRSLGEIKLFLSSANGPSGLAGPAIVEICEIREGLKQSLKKEILINSGYDKKIAELELDFSNCNHTGFCLNPDYPTGLRDQLSFFAKNAVKSVYKFTERAYTPIDSLDQKLRQIFDFSGDDLEPIILRCSADCPQSGFVSLLWTNEFGFQTRLVLGLAAEVNAVGLSAFAPNFTTMKNPKIYLSDYAGTYKGSVTYEIWSERVKS
jgi:hypothetical protein